MTSTNSDFKSLFSNLSRLLGKMEVPDVSSLEPNYPVPANVKCQVNTYSAYPYKKRGVQQLVNTAYELHSVAGGATVSLADGNLAGQRLFAVSIYLERFIELTSIPTRQDILSFVCLNLDLLAKPAHAFGSWYRRSKCTHVLDVVVCLRDVKTAIALGRKFKQESVFDLAALQEITIERGV